MAPGCSGGSLDWISGTILHCGQALGQVAQGSGGVTNPGTIEEKCRCGSEGHCLVLDLAVLAQHYDMMILKVFSNLHNSMVL